MSRTGTELWTFCKAQLSAQMATLVDFSLTLLLATIFGLYYVTASFLGAVAGGVINCCTNYRWVFRPDGVKKKNIAVKYLMVWCGSILLNTLGTYALTEFTKQHFIYGKTTVAVLVAVLWNYQLQRCFVYRDTQLLERLRGKRTIDKTIETNKI